jgi:hypothetical protein
MQCRKLLAQPFDINQRFVVLTPSEVTGFAGSGNALPERLFKVNTPIWVGWQK